LKREKVTVLAVAVITIIAILAVSFIFIGDTNLGFSGHSHAEGGSGDEYIKIDVTVSSWKIPAISGYIPRTGISPQKTEEFWTINGDKKTQTSATVTVSITYSNIVAHSLNVTIMKLWFHYTDDAYIVDMTYTDCNGANTAGAVDKSGSDSKNLDGSSSDPLVIAGVPKDGNSYTVYAKFRVQVKGKGLKSGSIITADTGDSNANPSSFSAEWYTEEVSSGSASGSVSFSSWFTGIAAFSGAFLGGLLAVIARRKRR